MTQSKQDIEELKALQQKSAELRKRQDISGPESVAETVPAPEETSEPGSVAAAESESSAEQNNIISDLATQLESVIHELEEVASERPALALLAAFGIGVVVGRILTRR